MKIYLFLIFLSLNSCNRSLEFRVSKFLNLTDDNFELNTPYVIIPNAGCPDCLSSAEDFVLKFKGSSCVKFVFIEVTSLKQLKIKLGNDILKYSNVLLDNNGFSSELDLHTFYPLIFYPHNNLLQEISPKNPEAISNLIESISIDGCK